MKTITLFIFCIFAIPLSAKEQPCPANIKTNQAIVRGPFAWRTFEDSNDIHILRSVDFYDGNPKAMAQLAPDNADSKNDPSWTFNGKSEIWQVCRYTNTKVSLTKNLGRNLKSCSVKFNPQIHPEIESVSCK